MTTIYMTSLYTTLYEISNSLSLILSTLIILVWMVITSLGGFFADKIGLNKYLKNMITLAAFSIFVLYFVDSYFKSFFSLLFLQIFLSVVGGLVFAPVPGLLKQSFPTKVRFSGVSISNTAAQAILGGAPPFYATLLIAVTGLDYSPAFILLFACFLGYLGLKMFDKEAFQMSIACLQSS